MNEGMRYWKEELGTEGRNIGLGRRRIGKVKKVRRSDEDWDIDENKDRRGEE
jgi:hypothetical protein